MKYKKNILVYNNVLFLISETFMFHQVQALSKNYDIQLIANKYVNPHGFQLDKFEMQVIDTPYSLTDRLAGKAVRSVYKTRMNLDLRSYLKLRKFLRNENIKAIHAHYGHRGLEMLGFAKFHKLPLVVSFHGYDASELLEDDDYKKKLPELFHYASAIIISGKHMFDNLKLDPWKEKVHFIPYGVNPDEFQYPSNNKSKVKIKILHSGRIVGKKGVPDLIKVFHELTASYNDIELHIVGDGKQLSDCKELVVNFGLEEKVSFYGAVSHEKVKEMLNEADIFVLNSRTDEKGDMEGTPVTILEAMCMGKAVVSTYHAGIPYVIEHGKNGLLAHERANDELKKNIETLIRDSRMREKLGHAAKKTINESYTSKIMEEKLLSVFDEI